MDVFYHLTEADELADARDSLRLKTMKREKTYRLVCDYVPCHDQWDGRPYETCSVCRFGIGLPMHTQPN